MAREPGLVSRTVTPIGTSGVEVHEIWDLRVEGCAMLVFDLYPQFKQSEFAVRLEKTFQMPREIYNNL